MSNDGNCNSRRGNEVVRVSPANLNPDLSRSVQDDTQCSDNQSTDSTINRTLNSDREPPRKVEEDVRLYPANCKPNLSHSVQDDTWCSVNQSTDSTINQTQSSDRDTPHTVDQSTDSSSTRIVDPVSGNRRQLNQSASGTIKQSLIPENDINCKLNHSAERTDNLKTDTNGMESLEDIAAKPNARWYLHAVVQDKPITMLFDTGSSTSLIPRSFYESLGPDKPTLTEVQTPFVAVEGSKIRVLGRGLFSFETGVKKYMWPLLVADITGDEGVLGTDFINTQGRAVYQGTLKWKTKHGVVQLIGSNSNHVAKIQVEQTVSIPPESERFISGRIYTPFGTG